MRFDGSIRNICAATVLMYRRTAGQSDWLRVTRLSPWTRSKTEDLGAAPLRSQLSLSLPESSAVFTMAPGSAPISWKPAWQKSTRLAVHLYTN